MRGCGWVPCEAAWRVGCDRGCAAIAGQARRAVPDPRGSQPANPVSQNRMWSASKIRDDDEIDAPGFRARRDGPAHREFMKHRREAWSAGIGEAVHQPSPTSGRRASRVASWSSSCTLK